MTSSTKRCLKIRGEGVGPQWADESWDAVDEGLDAVNEGLEADGGDDVLESAWAIDVGREVVANDNVITSVTSAPSTATSTSLVTSPLVPRTFALSFGCPNSLTSLA